MNFAYLVQLFFSVATRSNENPTNPVSSRRQCHRHHALRNPIQLEGNESLFQVITTALIGMLRNRVINPDAAKHSAVAMSHQKRGLSARPSTAAVTVARIVAIPRIGSAGWRVRTPCWCKATYVPALSPAGLNTSHTANMAPTRSAANSRLAKSMIAANI